MLEDQRAVFLVHVSLNRSPCAAHANTSAIVAVSCSKQARSISWISGSHPVGSLSSTEIVVEQIPAGTIVTRAERFLGAFLAPKGSDRGPGRDKQSNWRSVEGSRRHRARIGGYHDRSAYTLRVRYASMPLTNHFGYLIKSVSLCVSIRPSGSCGLISTRAAQS